MVRAYRFGAFELDLRAGELRRSGFRVRIQEKPRRLLVALLERPGEVLDRDELCRRLWAEGTFVEFEPSLNNAALRLREALGDSAQTPRFVETVARRGYRFVAPVEIVDAPDARVSPPPAGETPAVAEDLPDAPVARARPRARLLWIVVLLLAVAGPVAWLLRPRRPEPARRGRLTLAVLPYRNLSGDPAEEYFSDGLSDELIAQLARLQPERLGVIARTSSMSYKRTTRRLREIGRELGASYLIEGSVRREGDRLRIQTALVDAESERYVWTRTYDRQLRDVLDIQTDVARSVADEVRLEVAPARRAQLGSTRPVDPAAFDSYLRGRHFWNRRAPDDLQRALTFFGQALARSPQFEAAHAGLADTYVYLGWYGFAPPREVFPKARESAQAALALDPELAEAHGVLGIVGLLYDWDRAGAAAALRRALDLQPHQPTLRHWHGFSLAVAGRFDEAIAEVRAGTELDPRSTGVRAGLAYALLSAGRHADAVAECRQALELDAGALAAYKILGWTYEEQGAYGDALRTFADGEAASGVSLDADRARTLALMGRGAEARELLGRIEPALPGGYVPATYRARVLVALGEREAALALLERALEDRAPELVHPRFAAEFQPLRDDEAFKRIQAAVRAPRQP